MFRDHSEPTTSARQTLVESEGTPFAPHDAVRPVVRVMDGQQTNADCAPADWLRALEAGAGKVAIYFEVAAQNEWWLAYDPGGEYDDEFDGPYLNWTTYPTGPWDLSALPRGILKMNLEDTYGEHDRDRECEIRRSKVVRLADAPEFVQREVSNRD